MSEGAGFRFVYEDADIWPRSYIIIQLGLVGPMLAVGKTMAGEVRSIVVPLIAWHLLSCSSPRSTNKLTAAFMNTFPSLSCTSQCARLLHDILPRTPLGRSKMTNSRWWTCEAQGQVARTRETSRRSSFILKNAVTAVWVHRYVDSWLFWLIPLLISQVTSCGIICICEYKVLDSHLPCRKLDYILTRKVS